MSAGSTDARVTSTGSGGDTLHPVPTAALVALSVVTLVITGRLFDGEAHLRPALVLVLSTHAVALMIRWTRLHAVIAVPALAATTAVIAGVVLYRDTTFGPLPTGATAEALGADLRTVLDRFRTAVAPVPDRGAFANVTVLMLGVVAALSDTFAFRARGRAEAVVPHGVAVVLVAALANDDQRIGITVAWLTLALLVVASLRFAGWLEGGTVGGRRVTWATALPAMVAVAAISGVVAGVAGPRLPGADAAPLLDPGGGGSSVTEVVSPLVGIGARLTSGGNRELFRVSSSDGPHYWRMMALDDFDGANWSPSAESLTRDGAVAASSLGDVTGERVDQVVTVAALGGHLVPAAHVAVAVSPESVLFAPRSQSLVLPDVELQRGDVITVRSRVVSPTVAQLRGTTVAGAPSLTMYTVPASVPQSVRDAALAVTSGAPTPYDRAMALQDWFRTTGGFTYDLDVDYGSGPGAIADFLERRRGFCQQFATSYAAMARSIGLAARVVVGFTPGDLEASGDYRVYGRHAHAWPEVWFDGLGWVGFEPTPGRGSPDGVGYQPGVTPAQDDSGNDPATTTTTPGSGATTTPSSTTTPRPDGSTPTGGSTAPSTTRVTAGGGPGSSGSGTGTLVAVAVFVTLAVVAALTVRRSRRRHVDGAPDRVVERAWSSACRDLRALGATAVRGVTPLEFAGSANERTGVEPAAVDELARLVTVAVYSPVPPDDQFAQRCRDLAARIHEGCLATATPWTRLRSRLADRLH